MKIGYKILLSIKYLAGHFRRYIFLLVVLCFSFAVITATTTIVEGMTENVFLAAENHYAGHVFVLGYEKDKRSVLRITDSDTILNVVKNAGFKPAKTVLRTLSYNDASLYFSGVSVKQKYVYGIDWQVEQDDFKKLTFIDGEASDDFNNNGIFISEPVAHNLQARVNDDVLLEVQTKTGQKNTLKFIVRGIIRDSSIFGFFKCFVSRTSLNMLLGYDESDCSSIGLFFKKNDDLFEKTDILYTALENIFSLGDPIKNREDFTEQIRADFSGFRYFVFPLSVYISQVSDLLTAMKFISYFLYVLMIIIAISSLTVTYRLILYERSREIGTVRVLGMQSWNTQIVLVFESVFLFLVAVIAGLFLSLLFTWILSMFSYESIPGFDLFLRKGKLTASYTPGIIFTNILILLLTVLPVVWIPMFNISRADIVNTLRK
ncbi:MAG: FtsX-like permease family protein [Spirochaetales bacterium]|nr:FtsX-like permease family protein [Spirochaetales bacterium]